MKDEIVQITASIPQETRPQAETDEVAIDTWLHGRGVETTRAYRADVGRFRTYIRRPLREVTLADIQSFADSLHRGLAPASKHRTLSAVKSFYSFATRIGYLRFDVARPLRLPVLRDRLAERILSEDEVRRMIEGERQPRNRTLLYILYSTAIRVSECCGLKWRDVLRRDGGGQITVLGKGAKTNTILLPVSVWSLLTCLRDSASDDDAVFSSRKQKHLHPTQVRRIVRRAAKRAGISKPVSPHWLRHAHCSHALDRGAPIHLVQATVGHSSVSTTGRYLHARPGESSGDYLHI